MIFAQRGNQLIVPNGVSFEARCLGRQFNDFRLERSFEEKFDLSCRIGAMRRAQHSPGKFGLDSNQQGWRERGTIGASCRPEVLGDNQVDCSRKSRSRACKASERLSDR
jgi:hypothetical protein